MAKKTKTTELARLEKLLKILKKREPTEAILVRIERVKANIDTIKVIPPKEFKIIIKEEAVARRIELEKELARLKGEDE